MSSLYDFCKDSRANALKCLNDALTNNVDKSVCNTYFQLFKDCKSDWQKSRNPETQKNHKNADKSQRSL